jgi:uncharacterized membrane protein
MDTNMSSDTVDSLIHLYRGELGRTVSYRLRLDTTTNWAIVTNVAVTTLAFGSAEVSPTIFVFAMLLTFFFLHLETRRYCLYERSQQRVRLLEKGFFSELLSGHETTAWRQAMVAHLQQPQTTMTYLQALGLRAWRNYLWLQLGLFVLWLVKLGAFQGGSLQPNNLPAKGVVFVVVTCQIAFVVLAVWSRITNNSGED